MEKLHFKVNAAIKNIIGKELIYSDNIAVVELIKNSKDAGAQEANIVFKNENDLFNGSIIISDNGKGMSLSEIKEKWLNIAYSEKKKHPDDIIYAGNKGVGRFSCDRLGSSLILLTKSVDGDYIKLNINWQDFENRNQNEEVSMIPVEYEILSKETFIKEAEVSDFTTGTILKIGALRDTWPTNKLKKLISELEKFSPSLEDDFIINIYSENKDKDLEGKLNKKINNNILEKVSFKTTYIKSKIDEEGKKITTTLFYQGQEVYSYTISNPYRELKNISVELHYIDTIARAYFTKKMGIRLVDYGSVFLFYNNYRISPYGNPKNDWLGVDQRKGQGRARYFGTRELFGRIDIIDKDGTFDVLTNREGLARNKAFHELIAYDKDDKINIYTDDESNDEAESYGYIINIIRQLEAFIVDALDWNKFVDTLNPDSKKVISDKDILLDPQRYQMKKIEPEKIQMVCERLLKSNWNIKDLKVNEDLIRHISEIANQKREEFLNDFLDKVENKNFNEMSKYERGTAKKIIQEERDRAKRAVEDKAKSDKIRIETEVKLQSKVKEVEEKEKTIEQINSINSFLKKSSNQDIEDLLVSMHSILVNTSTIRNNIISMLQCDGLSRDIKDFALNIYEANQKNDNIAKFATLYNFSDKNNEINGELTTFIDKYLAEYSSLKTKNKIKINNKLNLELSVNKEFIPLEIMMMLENIISNANKAKATQLTVENKLVGQKILFIFRDDGRGITNSRYLENINLIFDKGETSTTGSGLGLFQLKKTVTKLNGTVEVLKYNNCFELGVYFDAT